MSKIIRRTVKKRGTALIVALQLTALTFLSLVSFISGPQQAAKAPADTQVSAPAQTQTAAAAQDQTQAVQAPMRSASHDALRASAVYANKAYGARGTQIFNLATSRAESARQAAQHPAQGPEAPNAPTLTSDQEDYPPYSYVY